VYPNNVLSPLNKRSIDCETGYSEIFRY